MLPYPCRNIRRPWPSSVHTQITEDSEVTASTTPVPETVPSAKWTLSPTAIRGCLVRFLLGLRAVCPAVAGSGVQVLTCWRMGFLWARGRTVSSLQPCPLLPGHALGVVGKD